MKRRRRQEVNKGRRRRHAARNTRQSLRIDLPALSSRRMMRRHAPGDRIIIILCGGGGGRETAGPTESSKSPTTPQQRTSHTERATHKATKTGLLAPRPTDTRCGRYWGDARVWSTTTAAAKPRLQSCSDQRLDRVHLVGHLVAHRLIRPVPPTYPQQRRRPFPTFANSRAHGTRGRLLVHRCANAGISAIERKRSIYDRRPTRQ